MAFRDTGMMMKARMQMMMIRRALSLLLAAACCLVMPPFAEGHICVLVERPRTLSADTERQIRASLETWAAPPWANSSDIDRSQEGAWSVHFVAPPRPNSPISASWTRGNPFPEGLLLWAAWSLQIPKKCEWVFKTTLGTYLNMPAIQRRLGCLSRATTPEIQYLGIPKVVSTDADQDDDEELRVADTHAGIVLRRDTVEKLRSWFATCSSEKIGVPPIFFQYEDVFLGTCLWIHGVVLHAWVDSADEVFYQHRPGTFLHPSLAQFYGMRTLDRVMQRYGESGSTSHLQCIFLFGDLDVREAYIVDRMMGKSRRWFKNIGCNSGGFMFPELTTSHSNIRGQDRNEPVFSPIVRTALQQCLLTRALTKLSETTLPAAVASTSEAKLISGVELLEEWKHPKATDQPAAQRLREGETHLCVFVLTTTATQKHIDDAMASLKTWAANATKGLKDGSPRVFLVGRELEVSDDFVLRLAADVDLGYLYNPIRAFYLWNYLAKNHLDNCRWFAKVDADTYVNLPTLSERLRRYFEPDELHYLGSVKASRLGSGRVMDFAVNAAILSRGALKAASRWFEVCIDDLVKRKLGKGAEDIDLGYCLDFHGQLKVERAGARHEMMSTGMVKASGLKTLLAPESGACMLWQHPVHGEEIFKLDEELKAAIAAKSANSTDGTFSCDWPKEGMENPDRWNEYMRLFFWKDVPAVDCWSGDFNWESCCAPHFGKLGNPTCWDEEYRYERCCVAWNSSQPFSKQNHSEEVEEVSLSSPSLVEKRSEKPKKTTTVVAGEGRASELTLPPTSTTTPTTSAPASTTSNEVAGLVVGDRGSAASTSPPSMPIRLGGASAATTYPLGKLQSPGNQKCWNNEGFNFELCCTGAGVEDCWVWPYSRGFCCQAPWPPREPLQAGGLPGDIRAVSDQPFSSSSTSPKAPKEAPATTPTAQPSPTRGNSNAIKSEIPAASTSFAKRPKSARCATAIVAGSLTVEEAENLLACLSSLDEIGALFELKDIGSGDKASGWHDYLGAYERLLLHLPLTASVVEVGVRSGASLAMWAEYFPFGTCVGIDKNLNTFNTVGRRMLNEMGALRLNNVRVLQGNASDPSILPLLAEAGVQANTADAVVDDANHWAKDQIARFELFFPTILKPGGVYIIEDVHIQEPLSRDGIQAREYFTRLSAFPYLTDADILVGRHHIEAVRRNSPDWRHQVESVTFFRDMVAISKTPR